MSYSVELNCLYTLPVMAMQYRNISENEFPEDASRSMGSGGDTGEEGKRPGELVFTEQELAERIRRERAEATRQTEEGLAAKES